MKRLWFIFAASLLVSGCASYSTKTELPDHVQSIHIAKVTNGIDISNETTSRRKFQAYRPGLETEIRNAVQDRFVLDGHLMMRPLDTADALLEMSLMDFDRDALRYNPDESIQEYRIHIQVTAKLVDLSVAEDDPKRTLWQGGATGSSEYFLSGEQATTEDEAVADALEDLARHIVESVIEVW